MIKMIDIGLADAIAYQVQGKITEKEMKMVLAIFRKKNQEE